MTEKEPEKELMQKSGRAKGRGKDGCKREIENEAHSDSWKESV